MTQTFAAGLIFALTYLVMARGHFRPLRIDRAGAALLGGIAMVVAGGLRFEDAIAAIDWDTIALLLGMMLLVAQLRLAGFFDLVTAFAVRRAAHPLLLLSAIVLVSGVLSALLVNDTVCLILTPLVLSVVVRLGRRPLPYLVAVALAANAGSVATLTGNPQNMIVGSLSGIGYGAFASALTPVAAMALVLTVAVVAVMWRAEFLVAVRLRVTPPPVRLNAGMLAKGGAALAAVMAAFLAGVRPAEAALAAGALMLATRRVRPHRLYDGIDVPLLLMFCGLFVVVAGAQRALLTPDITQAVAALPLNHAAPLALLTVALSNLVSNVPAVLVLKPFLAPLADPRRAWLVVAMESTLAGNLFIMGSVANLIVVQAAAREGVAIGFGAYSRLGVPLTVLSLLAGLAWLG
jgi:Na+/H+ antiporter NhaD/arsenite permease-like protein